MQDLEVQIKKGVPNLFCNCFAMWSVLDLIKEVDDVVALVATKPTDEVFGNALVRGLCSKLPNLQPPLAAGSALTLIDKTQSLPEQLANMFKGSIEAQLMAKALEEPQSQTLKPQTLMYPQHYLTETEWKQLEDTQTSLHDKQQVLCNRLKLLGVTSLAEQTVRSCVALIVSTLTQAPAKDIAFEMVHSFKMGFNKCNTSAKQPFVRKYPDYPWGLSKEMMGVAYPKEQPHSKEVERFASLSASIPLRSTNKGVQAHRGAVQDAQGPSGTSLMVPSANNIMAPSGNNTMNPAAAAAWMQQLMLCARMQPWQLQPMQAGPSMAVGQPQLEGPNVADAAQQFKPQASAQAPLPLAIHPAPALPPLTPGQLRASPSVESMEDVDEQGNTPGNGIAAQTYEDQAYEALMAREHKKKQEPKAKAKGKAKSKAAPKAKAKLSTPAATSTKKPDKTKACSNKTKFVYTTTAPTASHLKSSREAYTDFHYHKAKNMAVSMGFEKDDALGFGRVARREAAELWAKAHE